MTSIQYNELFDFLVKRFDSVDSRLDRLEDRVGSLENKVDSLETKVGVLENKMGVVEITQDSILGQLQTLNQEMAISNHRMARIENWTIKAAKKINLPYHPQ